MIVAPVIAVAILVTGLWPRRATDAPPAWEGRLGSIALRRTLAREAASLRSPLSPPTDEDLRAGLSIYRNNCAGCHGEPGKPSPWGTKNFYPRVPQLTDVPSDLTTPQMFLVVKQGIRYSAMGGWDGLMPERAMWRVATFLSRVRSLPPAVAEGWKSP